MLKICKLYEYTGKRSSREKNSQEEKKGRWFECLSHQTAFNFRKNPTVLFPAPFKDR